MRRDNLIFDNNPEEEGERWDCSDKIWCFLKEKLTMNEENVSKMKIVRCHRLGCTYPNQKKIQDPSYVGSIILAINRLSGSSILNWQERFLDCLRTFPEKSSQRENV